MYELQAAFSNFEPTRVDELLQAQVLDSFSSYILCKRNKWRGVQGFEIDDNGLIVWKSNKRN